MNNTGSNLHFSSLQGAQKQIEELEYAGDQTQYTIVQISNEDYLIIDEQKRGEMQKIVDKEYRNFYGVVYNLIVNKIEEHHGLFLKDEITKDTFDWRIGQIKKAEKIFSSLFDKFLYVQEKDKVFHTRALTYVKQFLKSDITASTYEWNMGQLSEAMKMIPGTKAHFNTTQKGVKNDVIEKISNDIIEALEKLRAKFLHQEITKSTFDWKQKILKHDEKTIQDFILQSQSFKILIPNFIYLEDVKNASLSKKISGGSGPVKESDDVLLDKLLSNFDASYSINQGEDVGRDTSDVAINQSRQLKRKKTITTKLTQIIHIILNNCLKHLQGKKKKLDTPVVKTSKLPLNGLENSVVYAGLKEAIEKTGNIHYKEKLIKIIDSILMVYSTEHLFLQLDAEKKFDLTHVYPELIKNFQKQCVLDYENTQLIGKKDEILEGALNKFLEKVEHIFEEKFILDTRQTQVLKQYLSHKK